MSATQGRSGVVGSYLPAAAAPRLATEAKKVWEPSGASNRARASAAAAAAGAGAARGHLQMADRFGAPHAGVTKAGIDTVDLCRRMREYEMDGHVYDPQATYLKYRRILVDWMCEVGEDFRLARSTLHVAVGYLDRVLQKTPLSRDRLQLVAICCIIIAAKYEEAEEDVPPLPKLLEFSNGQYEPAAVHDVEVLLLNRLNWSLTVVTPQHYLDYYAAAGAVFTSDTMQGRALVAKVPRYVKKYVDFFAELCCQDYSFVQYRPSLLAATIVLASRKALGIFPYWTANLEPMLEYSLDQIEPCLEHVWSYYLESFPKEGAAAEKQYSESQRLAAERAPLSAIQTQQAAPTGRKPTGATTARRSTRRSQL